MKFHAAFLLPILAVIVAGCGSKPAETAPETTTEPTKASPPKAAAPVGLKELKIEDVKVGTGKNSAQDGDLVIVTYTGKFKSGEVFDSTKDHENKPFGFTLGLHQVVKGWDMGIKGMKVGGKRKLSVPSALGYGEQDSGKVPPNSDLYFDVELNALVKKGEEDIYDSKDIKVGSGATVAKGKKVDLSYHMMFANLVDSGKETISITVGAGDVLAAIDEAIIGMKQGGTRRVILPPALVRNSMSLGQKIPTQQVMVFDVTIDKVH